MSATLPGWAYPTSEAKKLHYFTAEGNPSLCRRDTRAGKRMSADNYWTIREVPGGFMAFHGFMSNLEDGHLADRPYRDAPFDTFDDASAAISDEWSEYGLIWEGNDE